MKKPLLIMIISIIAFLSFSNMNVLASNDNSISTYNIEKVKSRYKVTNSSRVVASKVKDFGKRIHYNGKVYYYLVGIHKYTDKKGYRKVMKFYDKQATDRINKVIKNSKNSKGNNDSNSDDSNNSNSDTASDDEETTDINVVANDDYKAAYRAEALSKINQLRASVGVQPLTEDPILDKVADIRVQQNIALGNGNLSHYDNNNQPLSDIVAKQLGINNDLGENLATTTIDSNDAKENADTLTQMYIDEGPGAFPDHGHYNNLVSPSYSKIGIGFGLADQGKYYESMYDAEDFE